MEENKIPVLPFKELHDAILEEAVRKAKEELYDELISYFNNVEAWNTEADLMRLKDRFIHDSQRK